MHDGLSVGTYSFLSTKITSFAIGNTDSGVISIGKQAFNGCSALTNVVVNGLAGWKTVSSSGAGDNFKGCTALKDFTMMSFPVEMQASAFSTHVGSSDYDYTIRFLVPRGIADPEELLAAGITPWRDLDASVKEQFATRWPGEKPPIGVINKDPARIGPLGAYSLPAKQFIA